jgi:hypothetical protein
MFINFDASGRPPQSLAARIVGAAFAVVAFGAVLMGAVVLFVGAVLAALAFWGYFWWKTRVLRRTMREQMKAQRFEPPGANINTNAPGHAPGKATIIEGEAVRVEEDRLRLK